ncbi:MAG: 3-deoxy-manno-octulosonate cytidylyltransferase [Chitinispirillaceae bacterium]|jgi:3-deoxy-manno-octulosonate cytidylyltransferase (CMP-KDO synthetase)|nr:3-deoxy-manno-octulosonate cytidylyltransferase [Chitinispirillaceae bacterium]
MSSGAPVCCVIPARFGSTRLPGKPLAEIQGLPLVMWVYNCALAAGVFDKIIVATDHEDIVASVQSHGGCAVMTSVAHRRGSERVFEAVKNEPAAFIVNLQGDEPDIPVSVLASFVEVLRTLDDNSLLTVASHATITDVENPHMVKVVLDADGNALYFSRSKIPYERESTGVFLRHKGIYGFPRAALTRYCSLPEGDLEKRESLEQLRALEHGMKIRCIVHDFDSAGIDTPEDLAAFRKRVSG